MALWRCVCGRTPREKQGSRTPRRSGPALVRPLVLGCGRPAPVVPRFRRGRLGAVVSPAGPAFAPVGFSYRVAVCAGCTQGFCHGGYRVAVCAWRCLEGLGRHGFFVKWRRGRQNSRLMSVVDATCRLSLEANARGRPEAASERRGAVGRPPLAKCRARRRPRGRGPRLWGMHGCPVGDASQENG